jgi:hypothetical protein
VLLAGPLALAGCDDGGDDVAASAGYPCGTAHFGEILRIESPAEEPVYVTTSARVWLGVIASEGNRVTWENQATRDAGAAELYYCRSAPSPLPPFTIVLCSWGADVAIGPGANPIAVDATNEAGVQRGRDCITVTRSR